MTYHFAKRTHNGDKGKKRGRGHTERPGRETGVPAWITFLLVGPALGHLGVQVRLQAGVVEVAVHGRVIIGEARARGDGFGLGDLEAVALGVLAGV